MSLTKEDIINAVAEMSVKDVVELIEAMEEKFGVTAAAAAVAVAGGEAGGGAAEEKSEFDVVITAAGDKKVNVIKAIRGITGLGLKEAKGMAEALPSTVLEAAAKDAAEDAKKQLEEAGASVELK